MISSTGWIKHVLRGLAALRSSHLRTFWVATEVGYYTLVPICILHSMKLKLVLYLPYKDAIAAATAAAATSMMAIKGIDDFFSSFFLFYCSVWHFAFL